MSRAGDLMFNDLGCYLIRSKTNATGVTSVLHHRCSGQRGYVFGGFLSTLSRPARTVLPAGLDLLLAPRINFYEMWWINNNLIGSSFNTRTRFVRQRYVGELLQWGPSGYVGRAIL